MGKALIFSAPSGSGKTTIVRLLLEKFPELEFSISATSRGMRAGEVDGRDYYFMSSEEFRTRVSSSEFIEHEEVYSGTSYGTLRSEIDRIWHLGNVVVFDVDVVGGCNLKRIFGDGALSIFVMPPSIDELRRRLEGRGTDSAEAIEKRISKASQELSFADQFDVTIVNDDLETAVAEATRVISDFIKS